jgi:spore germination cell wall hydrolase CwlJ-like protein
MRIPGLHHLILLLRRSPETEFERVMLLHQLRSRSVLLSIGAVVLAAGIGAAEAGRRYVDNELECLALTVYFEARGESPDGQMAVAKVVMNRVADERFPGSVCEVVKQGGRTDRNCHFSWWCDRRSDRPTNKREWEEARDVARIAYWGGGEDPTGGALWYHATNVKPIWRLTLQRGPTIGGHVFYRDKSAGGAGA